jgi:molybdopterin-guanine dinucleotide biosynthesis protein
MRPLPSEGAGKGIARVPFDVRDTCAARFRFAGARLHNGGNEFERVFYSAMKFTTVGVGGFSSDAGKTTLMCELLRALGAGWEAVKITRGHYRSCGKDPHACCVSHLLAAEPVIRSGRAETYAPGKDTGRYWDAGAANVHWVVVTDAQVERGINAALERVRSPGVLIEGTSFVQFVKVDLMLMAARASGAEKIKPSARRALSHTSAFYLFDEGEDAHAAHARFDAWSARALERNVTQAIPVYTREDLPRLIERVREVQRGLAA